MPAHEIIHAGPGEGYRFRSHERYVSDDGVHLTIDWHFIITINANGELVLEEHSIVDMNSGRSMSADSFSAPD
jgi:hypothetical protein